MNVPEFVGVPETVIVLFKKDAVTPFGKFVAAPIPVAPEVVKVITGDIGLFTHTVGFEDGGVTVTFPTFMVIFAVPGQPDSLVTFNV